MNRANKARQAVVGWLGILGFSVLAGVLVAALALPAVIVPSRASAAAISLFRIERSGSDAPLFRSTRERLNFRGF